MIVSPTGERTTLTLDAEGNLATVKEPGLPATQLHYATGGLLTEETDAGGGVHKFTYDASGLVSSDTDPDGVKSTVTASEAGGNRTVTVTSPLGHATTYTNGGSQEAGFHRTVTTPSGAQTVTTTAPDGTSVGTLLRRQHRHLQARARPALRRARSLRQRSDDQRALWPHLRPGPETDDDARRKNEPVQRHRLHPDLQTRPATGLDPGLQRHHPHLDPDRTGRPGGHGETRRKGHVVSVQEDAAETPTTFAVNGRGLVTETAQGTDKHEYAYDSHDRLVSSTDALGRSGHYEYDEAGRLKIPPRRRAARSTSSNTTPSAA